MDAYLLDWANVLLRWLHVITAIAWVGSSFYFVWLDNHLIRPKSPDLLEKGVDGALWAVHGGGFYNPQKYMLAPKKIHTELHWFYWESYSTWLSGFALFTVLYLWNAGTFLVDKSLFDWSPLAAGAGRAGLPGRLLARLRRHLPRAGPARERRPARGRGHHRGHRAGQLARLPALCRARRLPAGGRHDRHRDERQRLLLDHPGAAQVVAAMMAGQSADPIHGQRGKQRSVHNTYFTLPVLIAMLSNHYGWLYQGRYNWLVLVLLMLAGALIRHFFVARHKAHVKGVSPPWGCAIGGSAILVGLVVAMAPKPQPAQQAQAPATFAQVRAVIEQRCVLPQRAAAAEERGAARRRTHPQQAQAIYQQVAVLKLMPLNNATQITDAERALIKRWYEAGAKP
jgi:uncharacterized membrane protein